jgi:hypothetical protein
VNPAAPKKEPAKKKGAGNAAKNNKGAGGVRSHLHANGAAKDYD